MNFIRISNDLNKIRTSLGLDRNYSKGGKGRICGKGSKCVKDKDTQRVYHLDWQVVPYVPTQFPSLHRDVITLEEFAEGMAQVEEEERAAQQHGDCKVVSESESEDSDDDSEAETRSEDESVDSEMDEFVVDDDHQDTDKEEDDKREESEEEDENGPEAKPEKEKKRKRAMKNELANLGLSSGEVGDSFAVAREGLGKRKRRQTDHLANRIFQAGESEKEIDCYDTYDHEKGEFKAAAYHKPQSTRTLWQKPKKPVLAITGSNANWAKNAMRKNSSVPKKAKPGQRPSASTSRAAEDLKKRKNDIRAWFL